jgi:group II intron reverse transcriptase/maturase
MEAYCRTRKDGALGVDGVSGEDFSRQLKDNVEKLCQECKTGSYRAPPVRRVSIPKGDGTLRPLGIPTFSDKVLQRGIVMLLEPIFEMDFYDSSYGFRPGRSAHDCLRDLRVALTAMGGCFVVDVDIRKYFDTIPHNMLRDMIEQRIGDAVINRMISKWLNAGVMDNGGVSYSDVGSPQGGVISPLLANIYLHHVLDEWFHKVVKEHVTGSVHIFRYADDFVILTKTEADANRIMSALSNRLEKYGLKMNDKKSRIADLRNPGNGGRGDSFDFLGFTFHWGRDAEKQRTIRVKTAKSRVSRTISRIGDLCKKIRHFDIADQQKAINRRLNGHFNYYNVSYNQRGVWSIRFFTYRIWHYWLNRRDQKGRMPWPEFKAKVQNNYPLAQPRKPFVLWAIS